MLESGTALYTAEQVRALDRAAIVEQGIPGCVLMERAGRAVFDVARKYYPDSGLHIVCGTGNNGGDGFVVARLAADRGVPARIALVGDAGRIGGDARLAFDAAIAAGVSIAPWGEQAPGEGELIVDAVLGTGLSGPVKELQAKVIEAINGSELPVIAVDIPSGLCSDTGAVRGVAVRAAHTISFIGRKRGLYTGAAADLRGVLHFHDLGVPPATYRGVVPGAELLSLGSLLAALPARPRTAHKGRFGHVLVIGGAPGMAGAAAMAAEAAARCGAGLVSVATHASSVAPIVARCPELMAHAVAFVHELEPMLARATVLVVGPGLGRGPWAQQMLQRALAAGLPTVLDADALNALAAGEADARPWRDQLLLTPHPGEAARLLTMPVTQVNDDRFAALRRLADPTAVVVLKGAGTLVSTQDAELPVGVCPYGNPGMATGGMGDVLSGILGALLAQGAGRELAARLGVCLHGRAADLAAQESGERGLLATDLLPWLRRLLNE
ncbi:MAG: NAD(P)H-hydrate dehydratase [Gammaproteobacteria bacterium]|nr:NAD(P)H-hydrate dehydratase [Gammaproteobacteria bacterium]